MVEQVVREYRDHYRQHREPSCERCRVWVAYRDGDDKALDAVAGSTSELVAASRSHLGEGAWTDRETKEDW